MKPSLTLHRLINLILRPFILEALTYQPPFFNHWEAFELFAPMLTLPPPCALENHQASSDAGHELPRTIKSKAIFALILTEGYFGG